MASADLTGWQVLHFTFESAAISSFVVGVEYFRTQEIIKLQRRALQSNGFLPDEEKINNYILDELATHVYLLKRANSYTDSDYKDLAKLVKIYPIKTSFDKLIENASSKEEREYWEAKKFQLTPQ